MEFFIQKELANFHNPLKNGELDTHEIERRYDPLLERSALCNRALGEKVKMFTGTTDYNLIERLVLESRPTCIFCPEKVYSVTPRYPDSLIEGGRFVSDDVILFPNLFPLAPIHAVLTMPKYHFIHLYDFSETKLFSLFKTGFDFIRRLPSYRKNIVSVTVNANHLFPAGSSVLHPHMQVLGGEGESQAITSLHRAEESYYKRTGNCFWTDLIESERANQERYIGVLNGVEWIAAFAPIGSNEILGIIKDAETVLDVSEHQLHGLSKGVALVLNHYAEMGLSSFNFTIYSGSLKSGTPAARVFIRIISRQNMYEQYRSDDYFLQKLLGEEVILTVPEALAGILRIKFAKSLGFQDIPA